MSTGALQDGWTHVKLGDVATRTSKRCTPELSADVRWIGADHLDEGDLSVRRWSTTDDPMFPPTFYFAVPSGSVLVHSRNPKKVAILPFDAITGEKLFCLAPTNPSALDSRFLAYQLQSDHFHEFVGRWLSGSVNKFLNWTALERYEFALPPLQEQQKLAALLAQSDLMVRRIQSSIAGVDQLLRSLVTESYRHWQERGRMLTVPQFGELTMGRQKAPKYERGVNPVPYLRVADVGILQLQILDPPSMDFSVEEVARYRLRRGDVLITEGDIVSSANVGRAAVFEDGPDPCCFQNTLIRLRPSEGVDPYFVVAMLEGARLAGVLAAAAGTTTVSHLGLKKLSGVSLPMAPLDEQIVVSRRLREAIVLRRQLRRHEERAASAARTVRVEIGL